MSNSLGIQGHGDLELLPNTLVLDDTHSETIVFRNCVLDWERLTHSTSV